MSRSDPTVSGERSLVALAIAEDVVARALAGLEFEAVFFVGVDALVARHDELFGNFRFVGITRAATYLGLTCESVLPPALKSGGAPGGGGGAGTFSSRNSVPVLPTSRPA